MNEIFRKPAQVPRKPASPSGTPPGTTRAGDGMPRRKWSADELQRMLEAGITQSGERFELIGGDLVAMAAKGQHHELLKIALNFYWTRACTPELMIAQETPLRLDAHDEPEPDFILYPRSMRATDVRGDTVLLVVEVADSSPGDDLNLKAPIYASFGVREYWVINAIRQITTIHRDPKPEGYATRFEVPGNQRLVPLLAPALAVQLDTLEL